MHRLIQSLLFTLLSAAFFAAAAPPTHYYDSAQGRTGAELRAALHTIIRAHKVIPYSSSTKTDTADALKVLDREPANTNSVLLIYGTNTSPAASFGLTGGWNREHLWCDSYGLDGVQPAYSDLHNLRACDANVNSARGNKFFDDLTALNSGYRQPAHAKAGADTATDTTAWEPPAAQRGDIARALLYMTIRYTGDVAGEPRLILTDAPGTITATTNFMGRYTTLLQWHFTDPVSLAESNRNDAVGWLYQTNRNPFVDHPEWVAAAFIPPLRLMWAGGKLQLRWSADYSPVLRPETSANLTTGAWTLITNTPTLSSNTWAVPLEIPLPAGHRFFRLRLG